jgi:nitrite reductase/ring-hydroxylating ferredoxin subunit
MRHDPTSVQPDAEPAGDASRTGPFDYCPPLGFREYWYPAIEARRVGRRPVPLTMLGEELVLFRGADGRGPALRDWCPHRGSRLSLGKCEFPGTVTCPYHGYVFDASGRCVAGLIERPDSTFIDRLTTRTYPSAERDGPSRSRRTSPRSSPTRASQGCASSA